MQRGARERAEVLADRRREERMADAQAIVSGQDVREQERVGRAGRSVVVAAGQAVGVPQRHPVAEHRHRLRASVGAPLTRISPDSRRA